MLLTRDKVVVQSRDQSTTLPLAALDFSSFSKTWEKNSSYQLTFTAFDDDSLAFSTIAVENSVFYGGQEYIIKQLTDSYSGGVHSVQVTATHVFYQLNNVRQNDVKKGDNDFTIAEALSFLFTGVSGYSYTAIGSYNDKKTLTDFGNTTIADGLSTIASAFGVYCVFPDNHNVALFTETAWVRKTQKAFRYRHDSNDVSLQYDSSKIVNRIQVVSTAETPLFSSFYVSDTASINQWGVKDGARVEDDKNSDPTSARTSASNSLVTQPDVSLTLTTNAKNLNFGEEWTLVVPESGFSTKVQIVSITFNPFMPGNASVTLNNTRQNFLDAFNARNREIINIKKDMGNSGGSGESNKPNMWVIGKVSS